MFDPKCDVETTKEQRAAIADVVIGSGELARVYFDGLKVRRVQLGETGWTFIEFEAEGSNIMIPPWDDLDLAVRRVLGRPRERTRFESVKDLHIAGRGRCFVLPVTDETDRELSAAYHARASVTIDGNQFQITALERGMVKERIGVLVRDPRAKQEGGGDGK